MKRIIPLFLLIFLTYGISTVSAGISLEFTPEPLHGQLWARETYLLNISGPVVNISLPEYSDLDITGNLVYNGSVSWKGLGNYHHGTASTGYSYNLDKSYFQLLTDLSDPYAFINITLDRDAYQYGMKPFEEVHMTFRVDAYLEIEEDGVISLGPKIETETKLLILADDEKVEYLYNKFSEMEADVNLVLLSPGLEALNKTQFSEFVKVMNQTLSVGDYPEALDLWQKWDNKERLRMFSAFVRFAETDSLALEVLQEVEVERDLIQTEFDHLEDKYVAIFKENKLNLAELEATKQGLTSAITGVFLSAIVFFFLGRRSNGAMNDA